MMILEEKEMKCRNNANQEAIAVCQKHEAGFCRECCERLNIDYCCECIDPDEGIRNEAIGSLF